LRVRSLIAGAALLGSLSACAPVSSTASVLKADLALSAAETAGAKQHAPYEYTAAVEYLAKAREEAGYSRFAASVDFADKALRLASDAKNKALAVSQAGQPVSLPPPAPSAPR
jgi:hypothetical protein